MMKVVDYVQESMFGSTVTFRRYEAVNGSKNELICLHGIGEKGPVDGSELYEVEKNLGFPQWAAKGVDFPFNITAVQTDVDGYSVERRVLPAYLKLKLGIEKIIVTGLSMGGIGTYEFARDDKYGLIRAIAPVCGNLDVKYAEAFPNIPIWAFHGDKDIKVSFKSDQNFINAYNATHTRKAEFRAYPGVAHNAWDYAYRMDHSMDTPNLYDWILRRFIED